MIGLGDKPKYAYCPSLAPDFGDITYGSIKCEVFAVQRSGSHFESGRSTSSPLRAVSL